jgi:hypothetical protein
LQGIKKLPVTSFQLPEKTLKLSAISFQSSAKDENKCMVENTYRQRQISDFAQFAH